MAERELTPKQERFVAEYLKDSNGTQAAIRAGYAFSGASVEAARLLGNARISAIIAASQSEVLEKLQVDAMWVLQKWIEIATADPNELVQYHRIPCPECWEGSPAPEDEPPDPSCPKCHGDGRGSVFVHDTRKLSRSARRLYAGVQVGKDGIKVLMRDQDKALENIARHLGMFKDKIEHSGSISLAALVEGSFGKKPDEG